MELSQVKNYGATPVDLMWQHTYIMVGVFDIITGGISLQVSYVNPPKTGSPIS